MQSGTFFFGWITKILLKEKETIQLYTEGYKTLHRGIRAKWYILHAQCCG